jgi:RNA polymerase sigma factor (sigma-70 family)
MPITSSSSPQDRQREDLLCQNLITLCYTQSARLGVPFAEWADCAQEFVLRCLMRLRDKGELCEDHAYLLKAARNHVHNYLRDTNFWRNVTVDSDSPFLDQALPEEPLTILIQAEIQHEIEDLLSKLPKDRAMLWRAHYLDNEAIPELATRLGRSENAIRLSLSRANRELRQIIEKNNSTK